MPALAKCLSCGAEFPIEHKKSDPGAILSCPKCGDALSPAMISEEAAGAAASGGAASGPAPVVPDLDVLLPVFVKCETCGCEVTTEKTFCPECGSPMKERWQPRAGLKPRGDLKRPPAEQLEARRQRLLALARRLLKFPAGFYFLDAVWIGRVDDRPGVMISWVLCAAFLAFWWFGKKLHGPMVLASVAAQVVALVLAALKAFYPFYDPDGHASVGGVPILLIVTTLFPFASLVFWLMARRAGSGGAPAGGP
jgi:predicted RNA-binding Zn-ribbon protein involved in translation (DUF1610 family)